MALKREPLIIQFFKIIGPEKELEADAFGMVDRLDLLTSNEDNHFTREDVLAALELYNDNYITFPIDTISKLTEIRIDKNKRNGRKLDQHIKMVNSLRVMRRDVLGENEYKNSGRPTVQDKVNQWQREHPNGKKADCIRETGLSKPTVYKWWWTSE